jgi:cyclophilin family peptidyl-prolyl cis-trans isomerase
MKTSILYTPIFLLLIMSACKGDDESGTPDKKKSPPEASFSFERGNAYEITFYNTAEGESDPAEWDFGNGVTAEGDTVTYNFESEGTYTVSMMLKNKDGSDKAEKEVEVFEMSTIIEISTDFGDMLIYLYKATPLHRENFLKLTSEGFYNGTTFHRIISNFMIQGGDPNSKDGDPSTDGTGGPGYTIPAEILEEFKHVHGALGAARQGNQVNPEKASSGSQFYIVDNADGTPHLDGEYTVFGIAFSGLGVVNTIANQPKDANNRPVDNITMEVGLRYISIKDLEDIYDFVIPE